METVSREWLFAEAPEGRYLLEPPGYQMAIVTKELTPPEKGWRMMLPCDDGRRVYFYAK